MSCSHLYSDSYEEQRDELEVYLFIVYRFHSLPRELYYLPPILDFHCSSSTAPLYSCRAAARLFLKGIAAAL